MENHAHFSDEELTMKKLHDSFLILSVAFIASIFNACGSDAKINDHDISLISQAISIKLTKLNGYGETYEIHPQNSTIYADKYDRLKISVKYSVNGRTLSEPEADKYIKKQAWITNYSTSNSSTLDYNLNNSGHSQIIFYSIDNYEDTLKDTLDIYTSEPLSIENPIPENGFNRVSPNLENGVNLLWNVNGIDPWETITCNVYASYDSSTVWDSPIGKTDCKKGTLLKIPSSNKENKLFATTTIYWGIQAKSSINDNIYSPIFNFSTKFEQDTTAILTIPISYKDLWETQLVSTTITLVNGTNDTIAKYHNTNAFTNFSIYVAPQKNLHIYLEEKSLRDFLKQDFTIDIPEAAKYTAPKVEFVDRTPPQLILNKQTINRSSESVVFTLVDNGSGISTNDIKVSLISEITTSLDFTYSNNLLTFNVPKCANCRLQLDISDKSQNICIKKLWNLTADNNYANISGPLFDKEY